MTELTNPEGTELLMTELTNPEGTGFPPIGVGKTNNVDNVFKGNFNGLKHKLENLYVHNYSDTSRRYGLFGYIYGSTIKDFELTGSVITEVTRDIGGLTSYAKRSTFENIITRVTVTSKVGSSSVGGLIGSVGEEEGSVNKIINCINYGEISNGNNTGGLVGYLANKTSLIIEESSNYGTITNNLGSNLGGLIGRDNGTASNTTINKSHNYGKIKVDNNETIIANYYIGGLMGLANGSAIIEDSSNEIATIGEESGIYTLCNSSSICRVGGLFGEVGGGGSNTKIITKNSINNSSIKVNVIAASDIRIGGLFGALAGNSEIINSGNREKGIIDVSINSETTTSYIGGIAGILPNYTENTFLKVYNYGNIKRVEKNGKGSVAGGLIGQLAANLNIKNSNNTGEINVENTGLNDSINGGIIGSIFANKNFSSPLIIIEDCYNQGNIINGTKIGGIVGRTYNDLKLIINKCYNTGNLTGQEEFIGNVNVGGIVGGVALDSKAYIINSFNKGNLFGSHTKSTDSSSGIIGLVYDTGFSYVINSFNIGKLESALYSCGIANIAGKGNLKINNVFNSGNMIAPKQYGIFSSLENSTSETLNAYYKDGITGSNIAISGIEAMTENNMKGTDNNSLIYKLNANIQNINLNGIDEDLKDYTLVDWIIDSSTGYPTLNFKLEGNE